MYARDAAVRSRPTPPHVIVARSTLISGLVRNTRRTLARLVADRDPSRRTHLTELAMSCGLMSLSDFVHDEKITLRRVVRRLHLGDQ